MNDRRSKLEIYVDILEQISNGVMIPTRIMYGANLSWKPLQHILKELEAQELIKECAADEWDNRTKKAYKVTDKGVNVLRYFNKARELVTREIAPQIRNWK